MDPMCNTPSRQLADSCGAGFHVIPNSSCNLSPISPANQIKPDHHSPNSSFVTGHTATENELLSDNTPKQDFEHVSLGLEKTTNLIVNYLPQTLTDDEFYAMFASIGKLKSHKLVRDRQTGYSFGFGFVDYANLADADEAIHKLNGLKLQNKTIKVAYARPSTDRAKGTNLYIKGLPLKYTNEELNSIFAPFGRIIQARVLVDRATGQQKGVGFVLFSTKEESDKALHSMNGTTLPGSSAPLDMKYADENVGKGYSGAQRIQTVGHPHRSSGGPMRSRGGFRGGAGRFNPMAGGGRPSVGGDSGGSLAEKGPDGYILFVYNIGYHTDDNKLYNTFSPYGTVAKVNVIQDFERQQGKGYAFVAMPNQSEAQAAIDALNGIDFEGNTLQVRFKSAKGAGPPPSRGRGGDRGAFRSRGPLRGVSRGRGSDFRGRGREASYAPADPGYGVGYSYDNYGVETYDYSSYPETRYSGYESAAYGGYAPYHPAW